MNQRRCGTQRHSDFSMQCSADQRRNPLLTHSPGSCSTSVLRPPPSRRTQPPTSGSPSSSSRRPRPIVLGAIPVARHAAAIPPWPAARASLAANSRRPRSSRWGNNNAKRERIGEGSTIPPNYGTTTPHRGPTDQTNSVDFLRTLTTLIASSCYRAERRSSAITGPISRR